MAICLTISRWVRLSGCYAGYNAPPAARCSDNQRDDNAATRQKNQPDSVISNGDWYYSFGVSIALIIVSQGRTAHFTR